MTTLRGIVNSARTLTYYTRLQEVTANNLANANTDAFKADRMTAHRIVDVDSPVSVERTDLSQGALRVTGRPLDVGLEGDGYLVVETPRGERFIRGGALKLSGDGVLTDGDGNRVLGRNGPLALLGGEIKIRPDGTVLSDGHEVDQLRLEVPAEGAKLLKESAGRFVVSGDTDAVPDGGTRVRQGQLEDANFNSLTAMVSMVEIQRAYAANITALRTMDGVLGSITNDIGRV